MILLIIALSIVFFILLILYEITRKNKPVNNEVVIFTSNGVYSNIYGKSSNKFFIWRGK